MATLKRTSRGRFVKKVEKRNRTKTGTIEYDHNYSCDSRVLESETVHPKLHGLSKSDSWKQGRRVIEFDVLLSSLKYCQRCLLGPVPLTFFNGIGEMKKGLGGYLYVQCQNSDCRQINRVPYGKTYKPNKKRNGIDIFAVNTKLGVGK